MRFFQTKTERWYCSRMPFAAASAVVVASLALTAFAPGAPAFALGGRTLALTPIASLTEPTVKGVTRIVVDPSSHRVYTVSRLGHDLTAFDAVGSSVTLAYRVTIGSDPTDIALNPATHQVLVSDSTDNTVTVVDGDPDSPGDGTVLTTIPTLGLGSGDIAVDPAANVAFVANRVSASFSRVDLASGTATTGALGSPADDVAVDPVSHVAYFSSAALKSVIACGPLGTVTTAPVLGTPRALAWSGSRLLVGLDTPTAPDRYTVTSYDDDLTPVDFSPGLGEPITGLTVDPDLDTAYVSLQGGDLYALRGSTLTLESSSPIVPALVDGVAVDGSAHRLVTGHGTISGATIADYDISASAVITTDDLPNATIGVPYRSIIRTIARPAATFALTGALPDGLRLDAATGEIVGTPTVLGSFPFAVSANNGIDPTSSVRFEIIVDPQILAPTITSGPPPAGTVGQPYRHVVTAEASPAATFGVTFGALPSGLALDATTGKISGSPDAIGSSAFTISATNAVGVDSREYTLVVEPVIPIPTPSPTPTPPPPGSPGTTPSPTATATPPSPGDPGSGSASGNGAPAGRLAQTGGSPARPAVAHVALAMIVTGLVTIALRSRRRRI